MFILIIIRVQYGIFLFMFYLQNFLGNFRVDFGFLKFKNYKRKLKNMEDLFSKG